MPILRGPFTYLKTLVVFAPILISAGAIFLSAYNTDLKALAYILGLCINILFGYGLSLIIPWAKPGMDYGGDNGTARVVQAQSLGSVNCNIVGSNNGWGKQGFGSCPDTHALFFSFTAIYVLLGVIANGAANPFLPSLFYFLMILSAMFRVMGMNCCKWQDIIIGITFGTIIGWLWFSAVKYYETKTKTYMTYFNEPPDNNRCNLTNNVYKCNVTEKL
jgi:hypothetical protein